MQSKQTQISVEFSIPVTRLVSGHYNYIIMISEYKVNRCVKSVKIFRRC